MEDQIAGAIELLGLTVQRHGKPAIRDALDHPPARLRLPLGQAIVLEAMSETRRDEWQGFIVIINDGKNPAQVVRPLIIAWPVWDISE